MLNAAFEEVGATGPDYYPAPLRPTIDAVNGRVFEHVNNGVYKAGFARTQEAYDEAVTALFETLDALDERLSASAIWRARRSPRPISPVHHAGPLRSGLRRPFQVQPQAPGRLCQPVAVHARAVPAPGHRPDGRFPPHRAALLPQPREREPDRHRPKGRSSTGTTARPELIDQVDSTMAVGSARCRTARASSTAGRAHPDRPPPGRRPHHPAPCSRLRSVDPGSNPAACRAAAASTIPRSSACGRLPYGCAVSPYRAASCMMLERVPAGALPLDSRAGRGR